MNKVGVLIAGKAGVGKSTLAGFIHTELINSRTWAREFPVGHYPILASPIIIPMAEQLKIIAKDCFGWDGRKGSKGRRLLQVIGTEAGRAYNENIWVDYVLDKFLSFENNVLISDDVRFENEIERCREVLDYVLAVKIEGPQRIPLDENAKSHASEHGLDNYYDYDIIVSNRGSLNDLNLSSWGIANEVLRCLEKT